MAHVPLTLPVQSRRQLQTPSRSVVAKSRWTAGVGVAVNLSYAAGGVLLAIAVIAGGLVGVPVLSYYGTLESVVRCDRDAQRCGPVTTHPWQ